ncbi:MAG TPA: hypothetical protein VG796_14030 [Verrucomicrobiales bacterium]|jgi:hypothetical protein|nr:hypothetical protein [Verrucomicrobiales bacterium]
MNVPHLPSYPVPQNPFGAEWNEGLALSSPGEAADHAADQSDEWLAEHPASTLALAIGGSVTGGMAWTTLFLWWFHDWPDVMITLPLVLAAAAFGLFRWLFHRLH